MFEQEFIVTEGTITSVFSSEEEISIPSEINGVPVTGIGGSAFHGCDNLRSIAVPDSVTFIDENVFSCCSNLREIILDENNTEFIYDNGALFNKDKTRLIILPAGNNVTEYEIPDSVTSIGDGAFDETAWLEKTRKKIQ